MIRRERLTAHMDGEFGVFLIGLRISQPLMVHKWLPVILDMPKMIILQWADPGIDKAELLRDALRTFIRAQSAKRLVALGAWRSEMPDVPRRPAEPGP